MQTTYAKYLEVFSFNLLIYILKVFKLMKLLVPLSMRMCDLDCFQLRFQFFVEDFRDESPIQPKIDKNSLECMST